MPVRRYNIPMATEADGLRFRLLWATIRDDNNVVSAEAMERENPFVQSIIVDIHEGFDNFDNWLLGMSLEQFRSTRAPEPGPGLPEPASAAPDLSWQRTLPAGTRVGSWVHLGSHRFQVTRIAPVQGLVWLRNESGTEVTVNLEDSGALRPIGSPALPPMTEQPDPDSLWARLLESSSFDD